MWRFLVLVGALLLVACDVDLSSETPVISKQELSAPRYLKGGYWVLDVSSSNLDAWPAKWRWGKNRRGAIDGWNGSAKVRLVKLTDSGVHLLIFDDEKNTSKYFLMHRSERGVFQFDHVFVPDNSFTDEVAARHGFGFASSRDSLEGLGERFPGEAIPELFKDPEFLGTLTFSPAVYFLPMSRRADRLGHATRLPLEAREGDPITLAGPEFPDATGMAQPDGLDGTYVSELAQTENRTTDWLGLDGRGGEEEQVEVRRLPDGRFELFDSAGPTDRPGALARISLRAISLADIVELQQGADGSPRLVSRYNGLNHADSYTLDFQLEGKAAQLNVEQGGKFELSEDGETRTLDAAELRRVVTRGVLGTYVGILEELGDDSDAPAEAGGDADGGSRTRTIITLGRENARCWQLSVMVEKVTSAPPELIEMRTKLMREAARSHALVYSPGEISGARSLDQVWDLLSDPRFEHGTMSEGAFNLCDRPPA